LNKITVLTAYDFNTARALAEAGIDYILVGDSLAMVAFGYPDTKKINLGLMLACTRAVHRGAPNTKIITDLPLSEVTKPKDDVLKAAQQAIKAGANIVKIEGATKETLEQIKLLRENNIEVMGHIGYTPQSFDKPTVVREEEKLISEAKTLEEYGAMGIVLEMIPSEISKKITEAIKIPTIGIGAGADCSGQVLVSDDMLGRYNLINPKFLKRYANQYEDSVRAFKEYIEDVRLGTFPSNDNSY
jgi:3-methyl-2-oxobutanoate hydroxymethyltransferase